MSVKSNSKMSLFVLTSVDLAVAGERGVGHLAVDGVVLAGDAGHGLLQHGDVGVVRAAANAEGIVAGAASAVLRLGADAVVAGSVVRLRA